MPLARRRRLTFALLQRVVVLLQLCGARCMMQQCRARFSGLFRVTTVLTQHNAVLLEDSFHLRLVQVARRRRFAFVLLQHDAVLFISATTVHRHMRLDRLGVLPRLLAHRQRVLVTHCRRVAFVLLQHSAVVFLRRRRVALVLAQRSGMFLVHCRKRSAMVLLRRRRVAFVLPQCSAMLISKFCIDGSAHLGVLVVHRGMLA